MLLVAAGAIGLALLLLLLGGLGANVTGYLLAAPLSFTLVALFRGRVARRLGAVGIGPSAIEDLAPTVLVVGGFLLSVIHAYLIASHFA